VKQRLKYGVASAATYLTTSAAMAQVAPTTGTSGVVSGITQGLCSILSPFVGQSQFMSLLFLIGLAVILVLWMLNENKEGVIVWLLRSGIVIGVIINIFSLPGLLGLPAPC
jgi:hypothetical protein